MTRPTIITCALTGDGDTRTKNPAVPVTPEEIADDALAAAAGGAAVVHIHVRDPATTKGSRDVGLYRQVVDRIRASGTDVVLNLTAGMGGRLVLGPDGELPASPDSDLVSGLTRMAHVIALQPDMCSLDCGSYNTGDAHELYVSTRGMIEEMADRLKAIGVKPELECFELGHVRAACALCDAGRVAPPPFFQFALGVPGAAPADPRTIEQMSGMLPEGAVWAAFGVGRHQMPMVAQSMLMGGHVRVGLEDNIYLSRGEPATNRQLVERAAGIVTGLGGTVATPAEARMLLGLAGR
ncbi:3-keto-5-aminohexanoate cleavage protein [Phreatobacter sp.]|uniref:3-keto-5-aminohexanoate cleavage protein n=1 Tax=Phreatobacter sp. TaxID=1966341 RepID=UPI003F71C457